jgi:hypothetical protein
MSKLHQDSKLFHNFLNLNQIQFSKIDTAYTINYSSIELEISGGGVLHPRCCHASRMKLFSFLPCNFSFIVSDFAGAGQVNGNRNRGGGGVTTNHRWKLSQWPLAAVELREWRWWSLGQWRPEMVAMASSRRS